jgi:hypothetical protein
VRTQEHGRTKASMGIHHRITGIATPRESLVIPVPVAHLVSLSARLSPGSEVPTLWLLARLHAEAWRRAGTIRNPVSPILLF